MIIIRWIIAILTVTLFVFGIINGADLSFIKWIFILVGVGSIFDGIEKYLQKKSKKTYLVHFGFSFVWFALFISYLMCKNYLKALNQLQQNGA